MYHKFLLFLITCFIATNLFSQSELSVALILDEATLKASSFLNLIPEGREADYGFNSRSDFSRIKIEKPYKTYFVSVINDQLAFIFSDWRVPLSVDGDYKTLLTVQLSNGKAEVVDLGGNNLVHKIQEAESIFARDNMQRVLIRNTFLNRDYLAPGFNTLTDGTDKLSLKDINITILPSLYQLNKDEPISIHVKDFYQDTIDFINNRKQTDK